MNTLRHVSLLSGLVGAALLTLSGCASQVQHRKAPQPPLSPPPEYQQLGTQQSSSDHKQAAPAQAQPESPTLPQQQDNASVRARVPSSVGQIKPDAEQGFLPGVKRQQQAKGDPNAALPFEKRLQERDQRIKMGLEGTQQQSAPVGNVIDSGF